MSTRVRTLSKNVRYIVILNKSAIRYEAILRQIFDEKQHTPAKRKCVARLLSLLVCAKRPLRWYEIQGLFAFDEDDVNNPIDHNARKLRDDPMDLCLYLIERHIDNSVQLVHPTAKE